MNQLYKCTICAARIRQDRCKIHISNVHPHVRFNFSFFKAIEETTGRIENDVNTLTNTMAGTKFNLFQNDQVEADDSAGLEHFKHVPCEICQHTMPARNLLVHMERKHGDIVKQNGDSMVDGIGSSTERVQCGFCKNFMPAMALKGHIKRKHMNEDQNDNSLDVIDTTATEQLNFVSRLADKSKLAPESDLHVLCHLCGNSMPPSVLDGHMARKHRDVDQTDSVKIDMANVRSSTKVEIPAQEQQNIEAVDGEATKLLDRGGYEYAIYVTAEQLTELLDKQKISTKSGRFFMKSL